MPASEGPSQQTQKGKEQLVNIQNVEEFMSKYFVLKLLC